MWKHELYTISPFKKSNQAVNHILGRSSRENAQFEDVLKRTHIIIIGLGGVGGALLVNLVGLGVAGFTLVDGDRAEPSNVHRQFLCTLNGNATDSMYKVHLAKQHLERLYPPDHLPSIHPIPRFITSRNSGRAILQEAIMLEAPTIEYRLVIDCCDTLVSRYRVNDVLKDWKCTISGRAAQQRISWIYLWVNASQFHGQIGLHLIDVDPTLTASTGIHSSCYRCLFPESKTPLVPPSITVVTPTPLTLASMAAVNVIKILHAISQEHWHLLDALHRKVTLVDLWTESIESMTVTYEGCTCKVALKDDLSDTSGVNDSESPR